MGRRKDKGYHLVKRGKKWYVYHRYTEGGKLKGQSTGESDKTAATKKAISILKTARLYLEGDLDTDTGEPVLNETFDAIVDEMNALQERVIPEFDSLLEQYKTYTDKTYSPMDSKGRINFLTLFFAYCKTNEIYGVKHITHSTLEDYVASRKIVKSSTYTQATRLQAFFKWAVGHNLVLSNPIKAQSFKLTNKEKKVHVQGIIPLNDSQIADYEDLFKPNPRDYLFFMVALHTGMRCNEIMNLLFSNIDFANKLIYVRENKENKQLGIFKSTLKSENALRTVPLKDCLIPLLEDWKKNRPQEVYVIPIYGAKNRLNSYNFAHSVRRQVKTIHSDFHIHLLRHTFVTRGLVIGKVSIFEVAKWIGDTPEMVSKVYGHFVHSGNVDSF